MQGLSTLEQRTPPTRSIARDLPGGEALQLKSFVEKWVTSLSLRKGRELSSGEGELKIDLFAMVQRNKPSPRQGSTLPEGG